MKKQIVSLIILAGCVVSVQAKPKPKKNRAAGYNVDSAQAKPKQKPKITPHWKREATAYSANMALVKGYEKKGDKYTIEMNNLEAQLKSAKKDQRHAVIDTSKAVKQQALLALRNAPTPEARKTADKHVAIMHGTAPSVDIEGLNKQISSLEKQITNNNKKLSKALKAARNAALALDKLNDNNDMMKAFDESRQAAHVVKVQGGTLSDAPSQYRHSNTMGDVQDELEKSGHYQQKRDAKKAEEAVKNADAALKAQQDKAEKKQVKAQKKAKRAAAQKKKDQKKAAKKAKAGKSNNTTSLILTSTSAANRFKKKVLLEAENEGANGGIARPKGAALKW